MAMNRFNDELYQDSYRMSDDDLERWEDLLDHVKDQTLVYGA